MSARWGATPAHLLLVAKTEVGLKSINRIVYDAYLNGFYGKARTDWSFLRDHAEGVIATTGCVSGPVGRYLYPETKEKNKETKKMEVIKHEPDYDKARDWLRNGLDVFGDNFFLELQPHDFDKQKGLNEFLCNFAVNQGLEDRLILTNDAHYPTIDDKDTQKISNCVATKSTLENPKMSEAYEHDLYVKSYDQIGEELVRISEVDDNLVAHAIDNTRKIITKTKVKLPRGLNLVPEWPNAAQDLKRLLKDGFKRKVPKSNKQVYNDRLNYEYKLFVNKGFAEYFLVVADMVREAKKRGVFVGCGRGSAGGSLVAFLLDITEVDPIKWNLDLERFMAPNRGGYEMAFHSATEITELINELEESMV